MSMTPKRLERHLAAYLAIILEQWVSEGCREDT